MTDSILRSYQHYSHTTIVPFPAAIPTTAFTLLTGETDGFAFNATTENGTVSTKDTGTPANNLTDVAISASNIVQSGTSAKVVIWNDGTLHTVSAGQVAQEYNGTALKFGILIEPAATNLTIRSEDQENGSWSYDTPYTVTANNATSPLNDATANTLDSGTGSTGGFRNNATTAISSGATYTSSAFYKYTNNAWVVMIAFDNTFTHRANAWFDVQNGVAGTTSVGGSATIAGSTITSIGNGWYRCSMTFTLPATQSYAYTQLQTADNGSPAGASKTMQVWGYQWELGSRASTYIHTLDATVTRAKDSLKILTSTIPFSTTKGTIYVDGREQLVFQIDAGNDNNRILMYCNSNTTTRNLVTDSSTPQADLAGSIVAFANTRNQLTEAWQANDFDFSTNGAAATSDVSGSVPASISTMRLGTDATDDPSFGVYYRLVYVPRQVETDANNLETWRYNY